jgi:hypothetical protein
MPQLQVFVLTLVEMEKWWILKLGTVMMEELQLEMAEMLPVQWRQIGPVLLEMLLLLQSVQKFEETV